MSQKYVNIKRSVHDVPNLIELERFEELSKKPPTDKPVYYSVFYYNKEQYDKFKTTKTLKGITDVKSDNLIFDFDSPDMKNAKYDTIELIKRLKAKGYTDDNYKIFCSANKGFHVHLKLKTELTPNEMKILATKHLGKDLKTLDLKVYDPQRIFRLPNSLNEKSGLFKTQLTEKQLTLSVDVIKEFCKDQKLQNSSIKPIEIDNIVLKEETKVTTESVETDAMLKKPKHWLDYKWELLNAKGLKRGERSNAMMIIAATCRGFGYNREITESFLNHFDKQYAKVTEQGLDAEQVEKKLDSVFDENWKGGTYTYANDPWLQDYCKRVGITKIEEEIKSIKVGKLLNYFEKFSLNFEENILKTGIKEIDDNLLFLSGTHNGILGQPGSAKTTIMLKWIANLSKENIHSMFYSLDMSEEAIYAKLIQFATGLDFDRSVKLRKTDPVKFQKVAEIINETYKNVEFNFTSGVRVEDIESHIVDYEQATGNKIKFLGIDYLECIQGPYPDATANTGFISQQLKDLAKNNDLCSVILLQTQKHGGEVSEPLLSMKRIKGSSAIEQSASVVLTLWREGYDPRYQEDDNFISFAAVKNRFGKLWTGDFYWNGAKGDIFSLTDEQKNDLNELRERKKADKMLIQGQGWEGL